MRKLISLGLLAIVLSLVAIPVFAGNELECEPLKDGASKGLYGLCIAYHNAENSNAKQKILDNYNKKAGDPPVPPMPGTENERKKVTTCPCLDAIDVVGVGIEDWGMTVACFLDDDGTDQGIFVNPEPAEELNLPPNLTTFFTMSSDGVIRMCHIIQGLSATTVEVSDLDTYEYDECLNQLLPLCP